MATINLSRVPYKQEGTLSCESGKATGVAHYIDRAVVCSDDTSSSNERWASTPAAESPEVMCGEGVRCDWHEKKVQSHAQARDKRDVARRRRVHERGLNGRVPCDEDGHHLRGERLRAVSQQMARQRKLKQRRERVRFPLAMAEASREDDGQVIEDDLVRGGVELNPGPVCAASGQSIMPKEEKVHNTRLLVCPICGAVLWRGGWRDAHPLGALDHPLVDDVEMSGLRVRKIKKTSPPVPPKPDSVAINAGPADHGAPAPLNGAALQAPLPVPQQEPAHHDPVLEGHQLSQKESVKFFRSVFGAVQQWTVTQTDCVLAYRGHDCRLVADRNVTETKQGMRVSHIQGLVHPRWIYVVCALFFCCITMTTILLEHSRTHSAYLEESRLFPSYDVGCYYFCNSESGSNSSVQLRYVTQKDCIESCDIMHAADRELYRKSVLMRESGDHSVWWRDFNWLVLTSLVSTGLYFALLHFFPATRKHLYYVPHVVASLVREYSPYTDEATLRGTVRQRMMRLSTLPIPDEYAVILTAGSSQVIEWLVRSQPFFDRDLGLGD